MRSKFTSLIAIIGLVIIGILLQNNVVEANTVGFTLADIEAFAAGESDSEVSGGSTSTTPPDPWNYVPDRYLTCTTKTYKLVCTNEGTLTYDGKTISGNYKKGVTYSVVVEIKNCDGKKKGAWCDQRQVGARVIHVSNTELE